MKIHAFILFLCFLFYFARLCAYTQMHMYSRIYLLAMLLQNVRPRSCNYPLQSNLLYGVQAYAESETYYGGMSLPEYICRNNQKYAEHRGFLVLIDFLLGLFIP